MSWRRGTDRDKGDTLRLATMAVLVAGLLTSGVAMVSAAVRLDMGPKVGDILVFRQGTRMPNDWQFTVASAADPSTPCNLRPDVMASGGGSLVVEQRYEKPRMFRVHWAGAHTSASATDCGESAELMVPGLDLQLLSNVVGGAGVEHTSFGAL